MHPPSLCEAGPTTAPLGTPASILAHDLRNHLTVAQGYLELAHQTGDDEHFEYVNRAHGRMERLINDVQWFAALDDGERPDIETTEPVSLANAVVDAWTAVVGPGTDATLEHHLKDVHIEANPERFAQLLENLLSNAVKHGHAPVSVYAELLTDTDERIIGFAIEDDGPGISESDRPTVFESGYTTSDRDGTAGLGLGIIQTIADAHGWDLSIADSATAHSGARFEITDVALA